MDGRRLPAGFTNQSGIQRHAVRLYLSADAHNVDWQAFRSHRRLHDGEVAGLEAALAAGKTSNTCSDVAIAFYTTLKKHGFEKESRCGYAGIDWTEPTASLKEGDMTALKPNMTFQLMLGNWIGEDVGYVISEIFRVTDAGGEPFTKLPRELFEISA
nr:hypothetical hydrolase/peptidase Y4TL [Bradyrhizobium sp. DOA9]